MAVVGFLAPVGSALMSCLGACFSCCAKKCCQSNKKRKADKKKKEVNIFKAQSTNSLDDIDGEDGVVIHNYTTVTCCGSNSRNANEDETYTAGGNQIVKQRQSGRSESGSTDKRGEKQRNKTSVSS